MYYIISTRKPTIFNAFSSGTRQPPLSHLLHALAADVAGDHKAVAALARNLVDLVDVHDAQLGQAHVEVGGLRGRAALLLGSASDSGGWRHRM